MRIDKDYFTQHPIQKDVEFNVFGECRKITNPKKLLKTKTSRLVVVNEFSKSKYKINLISHETPYFEDIKTAKDIQHLHVEDFKFIADLNIPYTKRDTIVTKEGYVYNLVTHQKSTVSKYIYAPNQKRIYVPVKYLVALAFLPTPKEFINLKFETLYSTQNSLMGRPHLILLHKNGNISDSRASNLQWATKTEFHETKNLLYVGSSVPGNIKKYVKNMYLLGYSTFNISEVFQCSEEEVLSIVNNSAVHSRKSLSKNEVLEVCEYLMENRPIKDISVLTGWPTNTIRRIFRKESYYGIVSKFNFPTTINKPGVVRISDALAHQVCKLLSEKYSCSEIARIVDGVSVTFVSKIKRRLIRKDIHSQYKW